MLNEERIKLMTKLAIYEQKQGKQEIPMSRYYRGDYVSYHLILSAITATLGFVIALAVAVSCQLQYLIDHITTMDILAVGRNVLAIYVVFLAVFLGISYLYYSTKFDNTREELKKYNANLKQLCKMYQMEEKMKEESEMGGIDEHDDTFSF